MWALLLFVFATSISSSRTVSTVSYGPSLKDLVTQPPSLQGVQAESNTIYLSKYIPSFTVFTPLLNGRVSVDRIQAMSFFHNFTQGSFFVQAPENHAVVAVVQILRLSQVTGKPEECFDYIQFTDVSKGTRSPAICGIIEGQDLDLEPSGLIGPRTFIASSGTLAVKFFVFTNKFHEHDVDSSRGVITVQLSFTAVPKGTLFNSAGILLTTHMRICQFINYNNKKVNDTWIYCPNPTVPDCVHVSLYCGESKIECATQDASLNSDYGMNPVLCDQFSGDLNPNNLTHKQKTWWRLSEMEIKTEEQSWKILVTEFVVMAIGGVLLGVFVSVFVWRLLSWWRPSKTEPSEETNDDKLE